MSAVSRTSAQGPTQSLYQTIGIIISLGGLRRGLGMSKERSREVRALRGWGSVDRLGGKSERLTSRHNLGGPIYKTRRCWRYMLFDCECIVDVMTAE